MSDPHSVQGFFATEPITDDWPSLFYPIWHPNKETAYQAPERATRYVVRLACWGKPSEVFESALDDLLLLAEDFVKAWDWVSSATARWSGSDRRIEMDFVCEDAEPGFPDSTAEVMADYVDRGVIACFTDPATGEMRVTSGQTAIVRVFVPD